MKGHFIAGLIAAAMFAALAARACGAVYPETDGGPVGDYAGILAQTDKQSISRMLTTIRRETGIDMRVVTIRGLGDLEAADLGIEGYATGLFDQWKVGGDTRNGAVLLISVNDGQVAIEAGNMDDRFYDRVMKEVIQSRMVPHFKEDDYGRGIYEGVRGLKKMFASRNTGLPGWMLPALFAIILLSAAAAVFFMAVRYIKPLKKKPTQAESAVDQAGSQEWGGGSSGKW